MKARRSATPTSPSSRSGGARSCPRRRSFPSVHDPSVLLTTAGMQPFKPYFLGREEPPAPRLADVQKCFRTTDIEEVGNTARHLTFFEMLGNWSFGDYFKAESIPWGWELATRGLRHGPGADLGDRLRRRRGARPRPRRGGDRDLAAVGVPEERIVLLGREDNFWQAGADRALRALLGALPRPRRGVRRRRRAARRRHRPLPRVLEPRLHDLRPLRGRDADRAADAQHRHRHGAGPDGGDPPGRSLGLRDRPGPAADRPRRGALRPLLRRGRRGDAGDADRRRPLARRRLPDRRRRRPLQRGPRLHPAPDHAPGDPAGRTLGLEAPWLGRFAERTIEIMGEAYPELAPSARRSPAGSATRRRASAAPSSAAASCSSGWSPRRRRRGPPGSTPPMPSSSTTPTASPTT